MKKTRDLLFYIITIGGFGLLMYYVLSKGKHQQAGNVVEQGSNGSAFGDFITTYKYNLAHPLAILLLQIITIIIVARIFAFICKKIRQPSVIGEIAAGIFLGPSFIGMYFPEFSSFLFPKQSLGNLQFLSQIGLILFMFIIGMELDLKVLKNKAREAIIISHASIVFPFALGIILSYYMYKDFAPEGVNFASFSLFMGIAMSITAFPVLARIVQERGLSKTRIGTIVITCAAADDITAWCLLAVVIAIVKAGSVISALYTVGLAVAYVLIMIKLVQPFLKRVGDIYSNKSGLSKPVVAIFFITLLVSSYATEVIGIHALFGAFLAGVIMPANVNFRNIFIEKVEDVSIVLLLPLFFVFTGLRTQIGLLNETHVILICVVVTCIAVAGKFLGSALAAKFVGQNWRDSLMIGALMNTRGLMELVVLNIGYDLGVLTPEVFAMMVIMALATTFMTGPALDIINRVWPEHKKADTPDFVVSKSAQYKILVSFGNSVRGVAMLRLMNNFVKKGKQSASITLVHFAPTNEVNQYNEKEYEEEVFKPLKEEVTKVDVPVHTMFKPSINVNDEIVETANTGDFDMLVIGMGSSVFDGTLLGKILGFTTKIINPERLYDTLVGKEKLFDTTAFDDNIKHMVRLVKIPVGIFLDKNFKKAEYIFLPVFSISDSFLLIYAQRLIHHNGSKVIILDAAGVIRQNPEMKETIRSIEQIAPNHIALHNERKIDKEMLEQQDVMLISLDSWKYAVETHSIWLSQSPSMLIMKP